MSITRVARRLRFSSPLPLRMEGITPSPAGAPYAYDLETFFEGEPDATSGMIVNLSTLESVLAPWLMAIENETPSEFSQRLADKIIRKKPFPGARLVKLRLFVTEDHWVDVWP